MKLDKSIKRLLIFAIAAFMMFGAFTLTASAADCDYEVWLYDSFGDGWDTTYGGPNTLDILVDSSVVLDDIYLATGSGPEVYSFTVSDGSTIEADYTAVGSFPYENGYEIYNSEGVLVTSEFGVGYPDYVGPADWTGTGSCPTSDCDWELCLEDSFGDGWDSGFIDVYVNGILYGSYTLSSGSGPECHIITVATGDTIDLDYTPGTWASENTWTLSDFEGTVIHSGSGSDANPDSSHVAYCEITDIDDVGVTDILSPADLDDATGALPVTVEVENFGTTDLTNVPVHVIIESMGGGGGGATSLYEDFEDGTMPADWTVDLGSGTGTWEVISYGAGVYTEPPGSGSYFCVADSDGHSSLTYDTVIMTPSLDFSGVTAAEISYARNFQDMAGCGDGEVRMYSGGTYTVLDSFNTDDPYGGLTDTVYFDPSIASDPGNVQIGFWYSTGGGTYCWGFGIDDVSIGPSAPRAVEYDETVNVDLLSGEVLTVTTLPDFTPPAEGQYTIEATTELADDEPDNDGMTLDIRLGNLDMELTEIYIPQSLMGPVPFNPKVNVTNVGNLAENDVPVHAVIEIPPQLEETFEAKFENVGGFNYVEDQKIGVKTEQSSTEKDTMTAKLNYERGVDVFQDVSDWTILDVDGDGETWHQHSDANEGSAAMYNGDDVALEYNNGAFDWMISPALNVGTGGEMTVDLKYDTEAYGSTYYDYLLVGNSPDGSSFGGYVFYGDSGGWQNDITIPLNPAYIAPDGTTYVGFMFSSDSSVSSYEGAHVDDVKVYSDLGGIVYDETLIEDFDVGESKVLEFPEADLTNIANYNIEVCTEVADDENPANDCMDLDFSNAAPVYILETGFGYPTIQDGIDAAEEGQTVVVTDGIYAEDISITKPITVTGENIESTYDASTCSWDHDHGATIHGTVYIDGMEPAGPPPGQDCDYEICLYDSWGDGWDSSYDYSIDSFLDVVVDGTTVLDDITCYATQDCYTFTVSDGSTIDIQYNGGGGAFESEHTYELFDSEGNLVYTSTAPPAASHTETATCPSGRANGGGTIFENFEVNPPTVFDAHDAAVLVTGKHVTVQQNTIHNVRGLCEDSYFTIKGIHVYGGDSADPMTDINILNNTIHDLLNEGTDTGGPGPGPGDNIYESDFEADDGGWTVDTSVGDWEWTNTYDVSNYDPSGSSSTQTPPPAAHSGSGLWGTVVYGPYTNSGSETTLSQTFDFSGETDVEMSFYSWPDVFGTWDYCQVFVNGVEEYYVDTYGPTAWEEVILDLSAYDGLSSVEIVFSLHASTVVNYGGWWIDDIVISSGGVARDSFYGGASGVMVQGFIDDINVMGNKIMDIQSAGWCYGVEYTPTNLPPASFAECEYEVCLIDSYGDGWDIGYGGPNTLDIIVDGTVVLDDIYLADGTGPECYTFTVSDGSTIEADYTGIGSYQAENEYIIYNSEGTEVVHQGAGGGVPGDWTGTGDCGGEPEPEGGPIVISCNYFTDIGVGSDYDVWNDTTVAPYPGVMFTVDEAAIPGPANAEMVTLKCNYFDDGCTKAYAVVNKDTEHQLDATLNWWGAPDGPNSDPFNGAVQDPITGYIADGLGSEIINLNEVLFDPWLGVNAIISEPMGTVTIEAGESVVFRSDGSFGYNFDGCENCCSAEEIPIQYLWDFGDDFLSSSANPVHVFEQPGTYEVSLMVDGFGFPYHGNMMYDWDYVTVIVEEAGAPLNANADGGNLGNYEATIGEPIQFYGLASGGEGKYFYTWNFGDGTTSHEQNPVHIYLDEEPATYTATLTVTCGGESATDTVEVTLLGVDELFVSIVGSSQVAQGDAITFTSTVSGGRGPYNYNWNFGDGVVSTEANPVHIYENSGTYTVTLSVTDAADQTETKTKTVTVGQTDIEEVDIDNVKAGLLLTATIDSNEQVSWSIDVQGNVFFGGHAEGTAEGSTQIRLPFSLGFGSVDITINAGDAQEHFTATMIGPFLLNLQEA